ncbi:hypothetical protein BDA96_01G452900 [Sorghum bicolor]|uniref:Uncharacterized protein n=1 Tax=Sorghum bicolor TaxID=4558 RepID=A0A921V1Y6_SORBI|nr:hypothetical protein BDA96_01G452900 [Sorghum bicolor]
MDGWDAACRAVGVDRRKSPSVLRRASCRAAAADLTLAHATLTPAAPLRQSHPRAPSQRPSHPPALPVRPRAFLFTAEAVKHLLPLPVPTTSRSDPSSCPSHPIAPSSS